MTTIKKLAAVAALAVTAALAAPAAGQAAQPNLDVSKTYRITTTWSLVLEIAAASKGDGAALDQWPVNGGANQQWRFEQTGSNSVRYRIRNVNSGKCLTAPGGSVAPWTKIVQWTCFRPGQEWNVEVNPGSSRRDPSVVISTSDNSAVLDVPSGTPVWGTQLHLWPFQASANQDFTLTPLN